MPWLAVREEVLVGLILERPVEEHLAELVRVLDAAWKQMAARHHLAERRQRPGLWHRADGGPGHEPSPPARHPEYETALATAPTRGTRKGRTARRPRPPR
ncbi:hypothetical protein RB201_38315 [Streptomyces sp. S1A(2023)]